MRLASFIHSVILPFSIHFQTSQSTINLLQQSQSINPSFNPSVFLLITQSNFHPSIHLYVRPSIPHPLVSKSPSPMPPQLPRVRCKKARTLLGLSLLCVCRERIRKQTAYPRDRLPGWNCAGSRTKCAGYRTSHAWSRTK